MASERGRAREREREVRGKLADTSLEGARIECDILDIIQSAVQVAWHIVMCTCVFRNLRAVVVVFVRVTLCCLGASLGFRSLVGHALARGGTGPHVRGTGVVVWGAV